MNALLNTLWQDDIGAVLSTEWVLLNGTLVFGVTGGLVAYRDSVNQAYRKLGDDLTATVPDPATVKTLIQNTQTNTVSQQVTVVVNGGTHLPINPPQQ